MAADVSTLTGTSTTARSHPWAGRWRLRTSAASQTDYARERWDDQPGTCFVCANSLNFLIGSPEKFDPRRHRAIISN
ncbi:hypothetical protein ACWD4G_07125 [Streptomyces sp. NPDC002643]